MRDKVLDVAWIFEDPGSWCQWWWSPEEEVPLCDVAAGLTYRAYI